MLWQYLCGLCHQFLGPESFTARCSLMQTKKMWKSNLIRGCSRLEYALKWRVIKRFLKWLGKRNAAPKQRLRLSPSQRKIHCNWEWQREEVESMQASRRNLIKTSWSAGEMRLAIWKTQISAAPEPEARRSFRKGVLTGKLKCNLGRRDGLNGFCCVLVCHHDCMYTTHCSLVIHTYSWTKMLEDIFVYMKDRKISNQLLCGRHQQKGKIAVLSWHARPNNS